MRTLFLALLLSGTALAHTEVVGMTPAANATVTAPQNVTLTLSEPDDLHFATFKVYALKTKGDSAALNRAAVELAQSALKAKGDEAKRVDRAQALNGLAAKVSLPLKPNLGAGHYVVMWRILSDDGHVVNGQSVFTIK